MLEVAAGACAYPVWVGDGLLARAGELLSPIARDGRLVVISDEQVWAAQGAALRAGLGPIAGDPVLVPPGEASKSWATLERLVDRLAALEVERGDHLLAFGGGVVGDLTGFAAAILKRGCGYLQVPTSLLAQVDSSVGGKTGINIAAGKNLVGAFHQPAAVLIDVGLLSTLPARQLRAGYAEIVKYGLISDPAFFAWCEAHGGALLAGDTRARLHAVEHSIRSKAALVGEDERDLAGRRALLNLGHTFGHAMEAETGFGDRLLHGEAVALGLVLAFRFAAIRGLCAAADADRVSAHLGSVGLPVTLGEAGIRASGARLAAHMRHDKKRVSGRTRFILPRAIGDIFVDGSVDLAEVANFLDGA